VDYFCERLFYEKICLFLIYLITIHTSIAGQDSVPTLKEVIVTTGRSTVNARLLPYSFAIADSQRMAKLNGRSVPELLDGMPGVFLQKTNHGGGSPFVRGFTGNQNLILIDGIRLNNAIFRYGPNQYLTLIDPQSVQKIEVIKGTGSVQYGSDALGGVINIITRMPHFSNQPKWTGKAYLQLTDGGMEKTFRPQVAYSNRKFAFSLSGSYADFGNLRGGDTTGYQIPSGYLQSSVESKILWYAGSDWMINAGFTAVKQQNVPLYHKYVLEKFIQSFSNPIERIQSVIGIKKVFKQRNLQQVSFQFSRQQMSENRISQPGNSTVVTFENDLINSTSFQSEAVWKLSRIWTTRVGIEYNFDKVFSSRIQQNTTTGESINKRGLYPDNATYQHAALYNLHQIQSGKWLIEVGLRFHQYAIQMEETTLGKIKVEPKAFVGLLGTSYALSKKVILYGNVSSGYRAPNIDDMGTLGIIDFRYEVPAYGLKPESSLNKELGIRFQMDKSQFSASYFHTSLQNLITRIRTDQVITGYNVYVKENVESAYVNGFETEFRFTLTPRLSGSGMITYLFGQNVTRNEPMRRIPPFNTYCNVDYSFKFIHVGFNFEQANAQTRLAQGDKDDNRIPLGGTPGYTLFHFYAGGSYKNLNYRVLANNLTNADYRKHGSGINGMGKSLTLTLKYNFN
jgi:outer membrane cobalamin receptor